MSAENAPDRLLKTVLLNDTFDAVEIHSRKKQGEAPEASIGGALSAEVSAVAPADPSSTLNVAVFDSCGSPAVAQGVASSTISLDDFTDNVFIRVDSPQTTPIFVELATMRAGNSAEIADARAGRARQSSNQQNTLCDSAREIGFALPYENWEVTCSRDLTDVTDCNDNDAFSEYGLWYTFVGNGTRLVASTCAPQSAGGLQDTAIEVFSGQCQDNETGDNESVCVAYGDDECDDLSVVNFFAEEGRRYWLFVHGWEKKGPSCQ
eukprot:m51a1_g12178 hypothetical protein (264) ;mRNA; f:31-1424